MTISGCPFNLRKRGVGGGGRGGKQAPDPGRQAESSGER